MTTDELKKELPPPGEIINVNGRRVHVQLTVIGSPTVVFESALFGEEVGIVQLAEPLLVKQTEEMIRKSLRSLKKLLETRYLEKSIGSVHDLQ